MYKINHRKLRLIGLVFILILSISGCKNNDQGLVARVEDEVITEEEFNTEYEVYKNIEVQQLGEEALKQIDEETGKTREEVIKDNVLEMLIMDKLIVVETTRDNITVSQEEIDEIMKEYIERVGGEEEFNKSLEESNMTKKFLEDSLKRSILIDKHRLDFLEKTIIEDQEAEAYFNENKDELTLVRASHILVKSEEEGKEILERLENGQRFEDLAMEFSADKSSGVLGGDLGYFGKGNYIAEFEEAAFALQVGEISSLVKTEVGYHIIRMDEKRDTYASLREELIAYLKDQKYYDALQNLRENAKIKIFM